MELSKRFLKMSGNADEDFDSDGSCSNESKKEIDKSKDLLADKFPSDSIKNTAAQAESTLPMEKYKKQTTSGDKHDSDKHDAKKRKRDKSKERKKTSKNEDTRVDSDGTCSNKDEARKVLENVKELSGSTKISLDLKCIPSDFSKNLTAEKRILSTDKTACSDIKDAKKRKSDQRKTFEMCRNEDDNPNVESDASYSNKGQTKNELDEAKDLSFAPKNIALDFNKHLPAESFSASDNFENINTTEKRKGGKPMETIERSKKKKKDRSSASSKNLVASEFSTAMETSDKPLSGKTDTKIQEKSTEPSQERKLPIPSEDNRPKIDDSISDKTLEDFGVTLTSNKDISVETKDEERARKIREKNWQEYKKKYQGSMKGQHSTTTGKNPNDTVNSEGFLRKDTVGIGDVGEKLSIEKIWESVRKTPDVLSTASQESRLKEKGRIPSKLRDLSPDSIKALKKAKKKKRDSAHGDQNKVDDQGSSKDYMGTSKAKTSEEVQKRKKIVEEANDPSSRASNPQLEGSVQNMETNETPLKQDFGSRIKIPTACDHQNKAGAQGLSNDCTGTTSKEKTSEEVQKSMQEVNEALKGGEPHLEGQETEGSIQKIGVTETPSKQVYVSKTKILTSDINDASQTIDTSKKKKTSACEDQNKADSQESNKDCTGTTSEEKISEDIQESMEEAYEPSLGGGDPQLGGQETEGSVQNMGVTETLSKQVLVPKIKNLTSDIINALQAKDTSKKKKTSACDDQNKADAQEFRKECTGTTSKEKNSEDVPESMEEAHEPSLDGGDPQLGSQETEGSVQKMGVISTPSKKVFGPRIKILTSDVINASQSKDTSTKEIAACDDQNEAGTQESSKDCTGTTSKEKTSEDVQGSRKNLKETNEPSKEGDPQIGGQEIEGSVPRIGLTETPSKQVFGSKIRILTPDIINASHARSTSEKKKKSSCDDQNKADSQESSKDCSEDVQESEKSMKEANEPSLKEGGLQVEGQETEGSVQKTERSKTPVNPVPQLKILSPHTINASQEKSNSKKKKKPSACNDKSEADVQGSSKDHAGTTPKEKTSETVQGSEESQRMEEANESSSKEKDTQNEGQETESSVEKVEMSKTPVNPVPEPKLKIPSPSTITALQAKNISKRKKNPFACSNKPQADVQGSSNDHTGTTSKEKTSENVLGSEKSQIMEEANESSKEKDPQVEGQESESTVLKMEVENFEAPKVESPWTTETKMETDESPADDFLSLDSKESKFEAFSKDAQALRNELQQLFGNDRKTEKASGSSMEIDEFFCDTHWSSEDILLLTEDGDDDSTSC